MKNLIVLIALVTLLFSCEKEEPFSNEIVSHPGESFDIEMESNWSTGYHWYWTNNSDISIVDSIDLNYIIEDPDLEGSSGTEIWTFKAKSLGEELLVFSYLGPGSTQNDVADTKEFHVLVSD